MKSFRNKPNFTFSEYQITTMVRILFLLMGVIVIGVFLTEIVIQQARICTPYVVFSSKVRDIGYTLDGSGEYFLFLENNLVLSSDQRIDKGTLIEKWENPCAK